MYPTVLGAHIIAGTLALTAGPLAVLWRRSGRRVHRVLTDGYLTCALATAATAAVISVLRWSAFFWLLPLSALTAALVLAGRRAAVQGGPAWIRLHGYGGSYIALVTALCVIAVRDQTLLLSVLAWAGPTVLGVPIIMGSHHRVAVTAGRSALRRRSHEPSGRQP